MLFSLNMDGTYHYLGQVLSIEEDEPFSDGAPYYQITTTTGCYGWVPNEYDWSTNFLVCPD